jgi:hypothetical protein
MQCDHRGHPVRSDDAAPRLQLRGEREAGLRLGQRVVPLPAAETHHREQPLVQRQVEDVAGLLAGLPAACDRLLRLARAVGTEHGLGQEVVAYREGLDVHPLRGP